MNRYFAALLAGFWLCSISCSKNSGQEADTGEAVPATSVELIFAQRGSITSSITAEAVLYPLRQATILPKISAPVQRFLVQRGDHVQAGQLLAVLEDRDLTAAAQESHQLYRQAEATYENISSAQMPDDLIKARSDARSAEEILDASKRVYESRVKLYKDGALAQKLVEDGKVAMVQAQSTLDTARQHLRSLETVGQAAQLRAAKAQVDAAEAHYNSAAAQLSYTLIYSPVKGIISDRPLNVGEMASSGSPLLTVVDISRVVARANLPVDAAAKVHIGQAGKITAHDTELTGRVSVVSPAVDPNTTIVQIWMEAANPEERIKLGSSVRIQIETGQINNTVIVPTSALLPSDEGGEKVMIAGHDSLAHNQPVEAGVRNGDQVQIIAGLKGGEQVIVSGALGLDDGAKIQVSKHGTYNESPAKKEK